MDSLARVYSFKHFDRPHQLWVEFTRSTFHGPHFWKCEARQQDGRVLHQRLVTSEHLQSIWDRYASRSEVTYLT